MHLVVNGTSRTRFFRALDGDFELKSGEAKAALMRLPTPDRLKAWRAAGVRIAPVDPAIVQAGHSLPDLVAHVFDGAPLPGHEETLLGSSIAPSEVEIHGRTVQLGEIVARAHADSGLTVAEWNELDDENRENLIAGAAQAIADELTPRALPAPPPTPAAQDGDGGTKGGDAPPAAGGAPTGSDPASLVAKHRGGGSYSVMDGEREVVQRLDKSLATAFNALDAEGKAAFVTERIPSGS